MMRKANGHNGDLTKLFDQDARGDDSVTDQILPLVYEQLRSIAQVRMAGERQDHTLQATALVHEAYARMMGDGDEAWKNRKHFFFAATRAMRQILIEHARAKGRIKRGGESKREPFFDFVAIADLASDVYSDEIIALDDALRRLEKEKPRVGQVVQLRFYGGMTVAETAELLGVSPRTVNFDWDFARAWLFRDISNTLKNEKDAQ